MNPEGDEGGQVRAVDHRAAEIASRIHAVQVAAYTQEAELLGAVSFPPLQRSALDVQRSNETFFAAFDQGELVGSVSVEPGEAPGEIWISSLTVDPRHQRKGIGRALVAAVLSHYPASILFVSTGARNAPALSLYAQAGFVEHARRTVGAEALMLVVLRRPKSSVSR
ncbi:MAG TPA: GNAT family N-acetyltransferase [Thermoanaerobaculia bacterium]|nr:GNAT family N-acetyltransferase [Thermoanaerobaculia bacterium]